MTLQPKKSDQEFLKELDLFLTSILSVNAFGDSGSGLDALTSEPRSRIVSEGIKGLEEKTIEFLEKWGEYAFDHRLICYDDITESVLKIEKISMEGSTDTALLVFKESILEFYKQKISIINDAKDLERLEEKKTMFLKIQRHVSLAVKQYTGIYMVLNDKIHEFVKNTSNNHYEMTKTLQRERKNFLRFQRELSETQKKLDETQEQQKYILTQFISILGVFAAILIGSFGAIQGFSSLFNSAQVLPMSKLLTMTSLGALGVILILFVLLNSLSKILGIPIDSKSKSFKEGIQRHFAISIIVAFLGFITLLGIFLYYFNRFFFDPSQLLILIIAIIFCITIILPAVVMITKKLFSQS